MVRTRGDDHNPRYGRIGSGGGDPVLTAPYSLHSLHSLPRTRCPVLVPPRSALHHPSGRTGYLRNGPVTSYVMPPDELPLVPRWLEK